MEHGEVPNEAYQQARARLSAARAELDRFGMGAQPVDSPPPEWSEATPEGWTAAVEEYQAAEKAFVEAEAQLRPGWAEDGSHPVD